MLFKKQYHREDFIKALSNSWQKTRQVADNIGCKNDLVTKTLLNLYDVVLVGKLGCYNVYNAVEVVEWRWVKGGKRGTREWKLRGDEQ